MAQGTIKWFAQGLHDLGEKLHDLSSDDIRWGLVTAATVPAVNTAAPHWGGTGTTNFATNQVGTGGTSYTGPVALAGEGWVLTATGGMFSANNPTTLAQDAAGPTNIAYLIVYNNTDANKRALAYMEISAAGTWSLVANQLGIDFSGAGNDVLSLTQS